MATSRLMTIPRSIFGSVGLNRERVDEKYYKWFLEFEESLALLAAKSEGSASLFSEEIDEIPDLFPLLFELECISLIFKLWLRRINLTTDSVKRKELQNFEHEILTTEGTVLKPYKKFLLLNQHKPLEELTSDSMILFYCQRLEQQWTKVSKEKEKTKFEMTEEDRKSMYKTDTVHVCSRLGLQLDFLDFLEEIQPNLRGVRTPCALVVRELRSNYDALAEKDSLDKEAILLKIGFDPLSSAVETILTRARNMEEEHIDVCELAEFFVQDEFKYNLLFSHQNERFPFQRNKTNEWFKLSNVELGSFEDDCLPEVNIVNLVTKESEDSIETTRSFLRNIEDEQHTLLFHGTDHKSAVDILNGRGIHLWSGRQKRDFSSGKGFYLTKNVKDALSWANSKTSKPAILVFREILNSKTRKLTLNQQDLDSWRKTVSLFRSGKQSAKTKQILNKYDLIEGPMATLRRETSNGELVFEPKPSSYQMCLISEDFAESFEENLHSILFY